MNRYTLVKTITLTKVVDADSEEEAVDLEYGSEDGWEVVGLPEDHTIEVITEQEVA